MLGPIPLDQTYDFILRTFVEKGQTPHFTEIGRTFGVSPDDGSALSSRADGQRFADWLFLSTDLIVSFAPFNSVPMHYRISIGQ